MSSPPPELTSGSSNQLVGVNCPPLFTAFHVTFEWFMVVLWSRVHGCLLTQLWAVEGRDNFLSIFIFSLNLAFHTLVNLADVREMVNRFVSHQGGSERLDPAHWCRAQVRPWALGVAPAQLICAQSFLHQPKALKHCSD